MSLISCPECSRHIRMNETSCPFCQADVADAIAGAFVRPMPAAGMSRAAMMAFAAASLGAAACSGSDVTPQTGNQGVRDGAADGMMGAGGASAGTGGNMAQPVYGAPFPTGGTANAGMGGISALYGAPPPPNTGGLMGAPAYGAPFPTTGGAPNSGTGGVMAIPLYGASPVPKP